LALPKPLAHDPTIERALPFEQPVINGKPTINYAGFAFRPGTRT